MLKKDRESAVKSEDASTVEEEEEMEETKASLKGLLEKMKRKKNEEQEEYSFGTNNQMDFMVQSEEEEREEDTGPATLFQEEKEQPRKLDMSFLELGQEAPAEEELLGKRAEPSLELPDEMVNSPSGSKKVKLT